MLGLVVMCCSSRHRWVSSANPRSPRQCIPRWSVLRVRSSRASGGPSAGDRALLRHPVPTGRPQTRHPRQGRSGTSFPRARGSAGRGTQQGEGGVVPGVAEGSDGFPVEGACVAGGVGDLVQGAAQQGAQRGQGRFGGVRGCAHNREPWHKTTVGTSVGGTGRNHALAHQREQFTGTLRGVIGRRQHPCVLRWCSAVLHRDVTGRHDVAQGGILIRMVRDTTARSDTWRNPGAASNPTVAASNPAECATKPQATALADQGPARSPCR
ncbi:hypothetical protein HNR07_001233 [Nocardiopsis metallicus]|uniref:Uncharacterized protein n=1 Tax=Nocardiopsis metallicus TaxID=179819 RepID=A0A840WFH0_9ACTN|nr:hypothetical protein [Nocardiopsis metallicus]